MRLLVTRPEPDASRFKTELEAAGHKVLLEPLLTITHRPPAQQDLAKAQALIVTSRNGLLALQDANVDGTLLAAAKTLPLFAVGPGCTQLAQTMGFADIHQGEGTARALLPLVTAAFSPGDGTIVHLAGDRLRFDMVSALKASGYDARKVQVYRTEAAQALSLQTQEALTAGGLDGVILMSPRTAKVWAGLVFQAGLEEPVRRLRHICLAETVARPLEGLQDINAVVADRPNSQEILALVNRLAAQSG